VKQRVYHVSIVLLDKRFPRSNITTYFASFKPAPMTLPPPQAGNANVTASPTRIRVAEDVLRGQATRKVKPVYARGGTVGAVTVKVVVSEAGQVVEAEALTGPPELRQAALEAAKQWTFRPTSVGGRPLQVEGALTLDFK
jgi:protein TonB